MCAAAEELSSTEMSDAQRSPERNRPSGGPGVLPVLLLPGMDGTGRLFAPLLATLPGSLSPRVIPYPPGAVSIEEIEAHAASQLPRDGSFAIVAESFAGPAALKLACRGPPGLVAVALAAGFVRSPASGFLSGLLSRMARGPLLRLAATPLLLRAALLDRAAPREVEEALAAIRSVDSRVLAARVRAALRVDARDSLRSAPCGILLLRGARDRLIPPRRALEMKAIRPDIEEVVLDAPHMVLQARPEEAASILERFLLREAATWTARGA